MPGQYPSFTRTSLWQMPQASTRMRTCPAGGCGISRSTISKSAPAFGTCTTFIFAIEILHSFLNSHSKPGRQKRKRTTSNDPPQLDRDLVSHPAVANGADELLGIH